MSARPITIEETKGLAGRMLTAREDHVFRQHEKRIVAGYDNRFDDRIAADLYKLIWDIRSGMVTE